MNVWETFEHWMWIGCGKHIRDVREIETDTETGLRLGPLPEVSVLKVSALGIETETFGLGLGRKIWISRPKIQIFLWKLTQIFKFSQPSGAAAPRPALFFLIIFYFSLRGNFSDFSQRVFSDSYKFDKLGKISSNFETRKWSKVAQNFTKIFPENDRKLDKILLKNIQKMTKNVRKMAKNCQKNVQKCLKKC